MVTGNGNRIPFRHILARPGEHIRDDSHRPSRRINVRSARNVFFKHIILNSTRELPHICSLAFGNRNVQGKQDRRRRVDGHRRGDFCQVDAVKEALHVFDGVDSHSYFPDFTNGQRIVRIQPDLSRKVKGYGKAGGAVGQEVLVTLIGFFGIAHARVLAHRPEPAPVHCGLHAASEGILAGIANFSFKIVPLKIGGRVNTVDWNVRGSFRILRRRIRNRCRSSFNVPCHECGFHAPVVNNKA